MHNFIKVPTIFVWQILIFHNFFAYPKILLQKYSTTKHRLKHKGTTHPIIILLIYSAV